MKSRSLLLSIVLLLFASIALAGPPSPVMLVSDLADCPAGWVCVDRSGNVKAPGSVSYRGCVVCR